MKELKQFDPKTHTNDCRYISATRKNLRYVEGPDIHKTYKTSSSQWVGIEWDGLCRDRSRPI